MAAQTGTALMNDFAGAERQVSMRWARCDLDLPSHSPHGLKRVLGAVHRQDDEPPVTGDVSFSK